MSKPRSAQRAPTYTFPAATPRSSVAQILHARRRHLYAKVAVCEVRFVINNLRGSVAQILHARPRCLYAKNAACEVRFAINNLRGSVAQILHARQRCLYAKVAVREMRFVIVSLWNSDLHGGVKLAARGQAGF